MFVSQCTQCVDEQVMVTNVIENQSGSSLMIKREESNSCNLENKIV